MVVVLDMLLDKLPERLQFTSQLLVWRRVEKELVDLDVVAVVGGS